MRTVYLDTNIPSFAATTRSDPLSLVRRDITLSFWRGPARSFQLFVSALVDAELEAGDWEGREKAIRLVAHLPRLPVNDEVQAAAETYVRARLMPRERFGDAFHLAYACVHAMDILLTWNIRHLANPRKTERLVLVNRRLGLLTPIICTPEALLEED